MKATLDKQKAYEGASYVVVATPTNYDSQTNCFDTSSVDKVVAEALEQNKTALVIIKSTIPVGHTTSLKRHHDTDRIIFSPEFLREGHALLDNLYPSRIIVGSKSEDGKLVAKLLAEGADKSNIETLLTDSDEAEAVKLLLTLFLQCAYHSLMNLTLTLSPTNLIVKVLLKVYVSIKELVEATITHLLGMVVIVYQKTLNSFWLTMTKFLKHL